MEAAQHDKPQVGDTFAYKGVRWWVRATDIQHGLNPNVIAVLAERVPPTQDKRPFVLLSDDHGLFPGVVFERQQ